MPKINDAQALYLSEKLHELAGLATAAAHGILERPPATRHLPVKRLKNEWDVFWAQFEQDLTD